MAKYLKPANMRKVFRFPDKELTHFYPGHMNRGMVGMQRRLKDVDCILELHDARIPLSGRNPKFEQALLVRPHMLLLNKADLTDMRHTTALYEIYRQQGVAHTMHISCVGNTEKVTKKLLPSVIEMVKSSPRYHRQGADHYNLLVIGVPNIGKSSLINLLRTANLGKANKATAVAPVAGVTRSVLTKIKISDIPRVYVYDTPGILHPDITDMEVGMNLALCATLKDSLVGEDTIVDYMLYKLNSQDIYKYVDFYKLPHPTDNVLEFLAFIAKQENFTIRKKSAQGGGHVYYPDFIRTAKIVLKDFRDGKLGKINLDRDKIEELINSEDVIL